MNKNNNIRNPRNRRGRRRRNRRGGNQNNISLRRNRFKNLGKSNNNIVSMYNNYQPTYMLNDRSVGFPDSLDVTLCYYNDLQLQSSVGEQQMIYEGNNPWDPDPQLGGRSADQYSVFASVYKYCRVYGSAIEVNYSVINSDSFQCLVTPKAENASSSFEILQCMPRSKIGRIVQAQGINSSLLKNDCNTASLYGIPNLDYDVANLFSLTNTEGSTAVTEPTRKWYWHVSFQNVASQNSLNGAAKIRIFYRCHFYGRKFASVLTTVTDDGDDDLPILAPSLETLVDDPV